ncbi:MAG: hypothetical protein JW910_18030, partial [Anaerolineae bacterium]|nr:hypothetical protein [Anaerolineae bacterium]
RATYAMNRAAWPADWRGPWLPIRWGSGIAYVRAEHVYLVRVIKEGMHEQRVDWPCDRHPAGAAAGRQC